MLKVSRKVRENAKEDYRNPPSRRFGFPRILVEEFYGKRSLTYLTKSFDQSGIWATRSHAAPTSKVAKDHEKCPNLRLNLQSVKRFTL